MNDAAESKVRSALETLLRELREKRTTGEANLRFAVHEGGPRLPIRTTVDKIVEK